MVLGAFVETQCSSKLARHIIPTWEGRSVTADVFLAEKYPATNFPVTSQTNTCAGDYYARP